jgi:hypothetical protein
VPSGSIAMLAAYEAMGLRSVIQESELFTKTVSLTANDALFYNTFVSILNAINSDAAEGRALEEAGESWLVARLVSARKAGISSIPLYKLLGGEVFVSDTLAPDVNISTPALHLEFYDGQSGYPFLLPPISKSPKTYAELFNKHVKVSDLTPCKIYKSSLGQNYDSMVVSENNGAVHVLFIDMKSKAIDIHSTAGAPDEEKTFILDIHQYDRIQGVIDELKSMNASELSKVSRALIAGNYTYVYMTTHANVEIGREPYPSNLIVMRESNTKAFLGILWDFYVSARSLLSKKWQKAAASDAQRCK